jgi:hypothetical protein
MSDVLNLAKDRWQVIRVAHVASIRQAIFVRDAVGGPAAGKREWRRDGTTSILNPGDV